MTCLSEVTGAERAQTPHGERQVRTRRWKRIAAEHLPLGRWQSSVLLSLSHTCGSPSFARSREGGENLTFSVADKLDAK